MIKNNFKKLSFKNLIIFLFFFIIEILIAKYATGFLRGFVGDILVVFLIYYFLKIFYRKKKFLVISLIFLFTFFVEIAQFYNISSFLDIKNSSLKIAVGDTFDWKDILAYALGVIILLAVSKNNNNK